MIPELTLRAVLLGLLLSMVMGAANVYLGLKVGMTVSASIPAAVVAMVFLRGIFRNGTVLEANQTQTAASAGESLAAGIIFTIPALVMIGAWPRFDFLLTAVTAFSGGLLGVLLMIPMRRVFVTSAHEELRFPEGVACAAVLEAGDQENPDRRNSKAIFSGAVFGGVVKLLTGFFGVIRGTLEGATILGQSLFYLGGDISVALFSVGIIVRLEIAVLLFAGGALSWLVVLPLMPIPPDSGGTPVEVAYAIWSHDIRYIGVGAMVVGGVVTIFQIRHGLRRALGLLLGGRASREIAASSTDRDLSAAWVAPLGLVALVLITILYRAITGHWNIAFTSAAVMFLMAFFFTAVASYVVGLVGNSNSPVSGMTITAVLFTAVWLLLIGFTGTLGMTATLGVAAIVCCTACTAGDICNDLKTGQLVGATPWRQQIMQIAGVAVAAVVLAPVLQLLHDTTPGGIGGKELSAPQAQLFASLVQGFFGAGRLPGQMLAVGALIGIGVVLVDYYLRRYRFPVRAHLMPIAVGMYLPLGLSVPVVAGGIMAALLRRKAAQGVQDPTILVASGAIAGEALTGILVALLVSLGFSRFQFGLGSSVVRTTTIAVIVLTFVFFYLAARPKLRDN